MDDFVNGLADLPTDGYGQEGQERSSLSPNLEGSGFEEGQEDFYEPFALPEGLDYEPEMVESFGYLAGELGLSQEQAQRAVDWYTERMKLGQADALTRQDSYVDQLKEQAMRDPEIGGAKWRGQAEVSVKLALSRLGTPELRQVIEDNPALACHPEIIRFFKRAGDLLREGRSVQGRAGVHSPSVAQVLFDKC